MYGFKILCEISMVLLEISPKILNPYTAKCAVLKIWRHLSYDILSLSETGPRSSNIIVCVNHYIITWNIANAQALTNYTSNELLKQLHKQRLLCHQDRT